MQTKTEVKMRLNPAYSAVKELYGNQKDGSFEVKFHKNQQNILFSTIQLPANDTALTISGKSYLPEKAPHLSIFEHYKQNEKQGLSVFHFTWYGFTKLGEEKSSIVLHVYFDQRGHYLYSQAKEAVLKELIPISPIEEQAIKKHAQADSKLKIDTILVHINGKYSSAHSKTNDYLFDLDNLSRNIKTQFPKYKLAAENCIKVMKEKDLWSFGARDPRIELLEDIIATAAKSIDEQNQTSKSYGFYSTEKTKNNSKNNKQLQPQPKTDKNLIRKTLINKHPNLPAEFLEELALIENRIIENNENNSILNVEKALNTLDLLNRKFRTLYKVIAVPFVENEMVSVLVRINSHYKSIESLFNEEALKGNVEAMKSLRQFIFHVDYLFFAELLDLGNLDICKYIVQNFDETIFYLNHAALCCSEDKSILESSQTFLQRVFTIHDSSDLLELLLQNGADPNFYGVNKEGYKGLLYFAIIAKRVDYVRVLLKHGANPNPESGEISVRKVDISKNSILKRNTLFKTIREAEKKPPVCSFNNENSLIFDALRTRNKDIIALMLEHGASVNSKYLHFDAIGYETCHATHFPDLEITKMLLAHGGDINAIQGDKELDAKTSPLIFACQRGDFKSVVAFLELGANPNLQIANKVTRLDKIEYFPITALGKAYFKGYNDIFNFLLEQKQWPISFITMAMLCAYTVKLHPRLAFDYDWKLIIDYPPMIQEMISKLKYDQKTITIGTNFAFKQGEFCFKEKKYEQALTYFYLYLLFGGQEQRQAAFYNLASCYKTVGDLELTIEFYKICNEYAPKSTIGMLAESKLELIESKNCVKQGYSM
jgi:ankyrin repeat protein